MKLTKILSVFCIFITMVSCSMNEDAMNDISKVMNGNADTHAYVSCNLDLTGISTKAISGSEFGDPPTEEIVDTETITTVLLFLLDANGAVLGYTENVNPADAKILTKVTAATFRVVAIVNASPVTSEKLKGCTSLSALKAVPLTKDDLNALVKVGESTFTFSELGITGVPETPSKYDASKYGNKSYPIALPTITVVQRAARIEIASLSFFYGAGATYPVTLESLELKNQNQAGKVEGLASMPDLQNTSISIDQTLGINGAFTEANGKFFYTFANGNTEGTNEDLRTSLVLNFKMNGESKPRTILIKHPKGDSFETKVEAGFLYRLTINVKVESGEILVSATGTVLDWDKNTVILDDIYAD